LAAPRFHLPVVITRAKLLVPLPHMIGAIPQKGGEILDIHMERLQVHMKFLQLRSPRGGGGFPLLALFGLPLQCSVQTLINRSQLEVRHPVQHLAVEMQPGSSRMPDVPGSIPRNVAAERSGCVVVVVVVVAGARLLWHSVQRNVVDGLQNVSGEMGEGGAPLVSTVVG